MSNARVPLRQRAEYLIYRTVVGRLAGLSEESLEKWTVRTSNFLRRVVKRRDRVAARNLANVFPDKSAAEREQILERCWRHFAGMAFRYLRSGDPSIAPRTISFENRHHIDEALALGKGVIVVTGHFGEWEGAAAAVELAGVPAIAIARRLDNPLLHEAVHTARSSLGLVMVDRKRAAKRMLQALRERQVVILLIDQAVKPREGVLLAFLGRPAWTATSPAKLALKTGAPILPLFCYPDDGGIRIAIEKPIDVAALAPAERTVEQILSTLSQSIERRILDRPELWLWMHDRWKGTR